MEQTQHNLRFQMAETQKRVEKLEGQNIDDLSNRLSFTEIQVQSIQDYFSNMSGKMQDLNKVHKSVLELREDVEAIETKADRITPEFRKEISKLDVSYAQVNIVFSLPYNF